MAGNWAIVGGQDRLLAADLRTRTLVWSAKVEGAACGLAVANGRLYASTDRGLIYCFAGPKSPSLSELLGYSQSSLRPGEPDSPPRVVSPEDPVFAAAADEILRRTGVTEAGASTTPAAMDNWPWPWPGEVNCRFVASSGMPPKSVRHVACWIRPDFTARGSPSTIACPPRRPIPITSPIWSFPDDRWFRKSGPPRQSR